MCCFIVQPWLSTISNSTLPFMINQLLVNLLISHVWDRAQETSMERPPQLACHLSWYCSMRVRSNLLRFSTGAFGGHLVCFPFWGAGAGRPPERTSFLFVNGPSTQHCSNVPVSIEQAPTPESAPNSKCDVEIIKQ